MVVLSNNDGCAITRSNEAKALGIKMGAPWFQIKHLEDEAGLVALSASTGMASETYGPTSPPSFAYIEGCIISSDSRADWEVISTNWGTTAVSKKDVNLRLVVSSEDDGIQNADFKEPWANCHSDQRATGYWLLV